MESIKTANILLIITLVVVAIIGAFVIFGKETVGADTVQKSIFGLTTSGKPKTVTPPANPPADKPKG